MTITTIRNLPLGHAFVVLMLNKIASIVGIIGVAFTFYVYFQSTEKPELTYFVYPYRTIIFQTGETNPGCTLNFQQETITTDVTAVNIGFWNAGRKAIPSNDNPELRYVVFRTANNERILTVKLRRQSRNDIEIGHTESPETPGQTTVFWNSLKHNDGGLLEIVYVGDEKVNIEAHATTEGQPNLVKLIYPHNKQGSGEPKNAIKEYRKALYVSLALFGSLMIIGVGFFLAVRSDPLRVVVPPTNHRRRRKQVIVICYFLLIFLSLFIVFGIILQLTSPMAAEPPPWI